MSDQSGTTDVANEAEVSTNPVEGDAAAQPVTDDPSVTDAQVGNVDADEAPETLPHVIPGVDGGELHITKNGETTTVAITDSGDGEHADSIEVDAAALEGSVASEAPANPGEVLGTSPTNPTETPVSPGIEPGQGVDDDPDAAPAPVVDTPPQNAPPSTDPGGDTAKENAPDTTAPEPDGSNVATNPGTDAGTNPSQVEAPESPASAQPTDDGQTPIGGTTVSDGPTAPDTAPAAAYSEKPLYTSGTGDIPPGYSDSGLVALDGKMLLHYEGDTAGEPHTGQLPVYADDAPVQLPPSA